MEKNQMKILELINLTKEDYTDLHPYIFRQTKEKPKMLKETENIIASPFKKFSVEMDEGHLTSNKGGLPLNVECIYCEELAPGDYKFICLITGANTIKVVIKSTKEETLLLSEKNPKFKDIDDGNLYSSFKDIVNNILSKVPNSKVGFINKSGRAKYKSNGKNKFFKPKKVIYVHSSKTVSNTDHLPSNIQWNHSWDVAAHWRRINSESYGLDREGNRTVKGYTFIQSYLKGEGEKIIKPRKVL